MIDSDNYIKKTCLNCKHLDKKLTEEPCYNCSDKHSQWEGNNERSNYSKDSQKE